MTVSNKKNPRRKNRKRALYRGSRRFDPTCRSNGSCPWCRANRLHKHKRQGAE